VAYAFNAFQSLSGPEAKRDQGWKALGKNPITKPDIGTCAFSCETRQENPENQWNFTDHLKHRNKKYEQQSRAHRRWKTSPNTFITPLGHERPVTAYVKLRLILENDANGQNYSLIPHGA